jgi:hypothetical protein
MSGKVHRSEFGLCGYAKRERVEPGANNSIWIEAQVMGKTAIKSSANIANTAHRSPLKEVNQLKKSWDE